MKQFTITENDANQRLDKFLKKLLPNASKTLIFKFNRKDKRHIENPFIESEINQIFNVSSICGSSLTYSPTGIFGSKDANTAFI